MWRKLCNNRVRVKKRSSLSPIILLDTNLRMHCISKITDYFCDFTRIVLLYWKLMIIKMLQRLAHIPAVPMQTTYNLGEYWIFNCQNSLSSRLLMKWIKIEDSQQKMHIDQYISIAFLWSNNNLTKIYHWMFGPALMVDYFFLSNTNFLYIAPLLFFAKTSWKLNSTQAYLLQLSIFPFKCIIKR